MDTISIVKCVMCTFVKPHVLSSPPALRRLCCLSCVCSIKGCMSDDGGGQGSLLALFVGRSINIAEGILCIILRIWRNVTLRFTSLNQCGSLGEFSI